MKKYVTACGGTIVVPCKAEEHLRAHPEVREILAEAIGKVSLPSSGEFLATEVNMGRVVGLYGCVEAPRIKVDDRAYFAQRIGRDKPTRVIPGARGVETTKVVVLAFPARGETGKYVLVSSWVGSLGHKEPWDANIQSQEEYQKSLDFWCSHALVHDSEVMGSVFESTWEEILGS